MEPFVDSLGISWHGLIINLINVTLLFMSTLAPAVWIFFDARKRKRDWSNTWLWMVLCLVLPLAGVILYLLLGRQTKSEDDDSSKALS